MSKLVPDSCCNIVEKYVLYLGKCISSRKILSKLLFKLIAEGVFMSPMKIKSLSHVMDLTFEVQH